MAEMYTSICHLTSWVCPPGACILKGIPQDLPRAEGLCACAQRILSVDYQLPYNKQVSLECKDLLECILVADPEKRITMANIQRHPWFTRDLPEGVAQMNDQLLAQQQHMLAQYGA